MTMVQGVFIRAGAQDLVPEAAPSPAVSSFSSDCPPLPS